MVYPLRVFADTMVTLTSCVISIPCVIFIVILVIISTINITDGKWVTILVINASVINTTMSREFEENSRSHHPLEEVKQYIHVHFQSPGLTWKTHLLSKSYPTLIPMIMIQLTGGLWNANSRHFVKAITHIAVEIRVLSLWIGLNLFVLQIWIFLV